MMNWLNGAHILSFISDTEERWRQTNLRIETQFLNAVCSHVPPRVAEDKSIRSKFNEGMIFDDDVRGKNGLKCWAFVSLAVVDILVDRVHPAARQSLSLFQKRPIQSRG